MNTDMATTAPPLARHIPMEVCENFIDMLYSPYRDFSDELENFAALRSCALVCRDWCIRAQRMLFYAVHLNDAASLYRFAAVLQAGPHLYACVHEVTLISRSLHTTASVLTLFPAVFAGKLPNLQRFRVWRMSDSESDAWFPATPESGSAKAKALPHAPLHPHFPVLIASFTTISTLQLAYIMFRSFGEFARVVYSLPTVETLMCHSVAWTTLGPLPAFMGTNGYSGRRTSRFAPNLRLLKYFASSIYGIQRLISACGPHLPRLWISFPLPDSLTELENNKGEGLDLSSCSALQKFTVRPTAEFSTDERFGYLLSTMLSSWKNPQPHAQLAFGVWYQTCHFTRQGYADILNALGTTADGWLEDMQKASDTTDVSGDTSANGSECQVFVRIYDWESRREWWWGHITASFPTWAKLGRLELGYSMPSTPRYQWKPDDDDDDDEQPYGTVASCSS
ncbi:hypothetical protein GSI_11290 [Ganoderma sinense ZZ0214-1]|uniref:F-box domain-containing protein n=1 Tax=Ganoderma sinense ZZ0214-1 TaxID=1077348 RepID=A0A2G8RYR4_9APHY|nr:hypothetical protein GSI_11290 [Ganoderma sinense ZZ0214-1]